MLLLAKWEYCFKRLLAKAIVPTTALTSHFDPNRYTMDAFDNFDHEEIAESGIGESHDTMSVLLQEKPSKDCRKPNTS